MHGNHSSSLQRLQDPATSASILRESGAVFLAVHNGRKVPGRAASTNQKYRPERLRNVLVRNAREPEAGFLTVTTPHCDPMV